MPCCLRSRRLAITEATEETLNTLLEEMGIDTSQFGVGESKPVSALAREINEGSCRLEVERSSGRVLRYVEPIFVQLRYGDKVLIERGRLQPTGKRRESRSLLSEKREPSDRGPFEAAIRGIREKLHVEVHKRLEGFVHEMVEDVTFTDKRDSASYPGIPAIYQTHYVHLLVKERSVAESAFKECGLPDCSDFETEETKKAGVVKLNWQWINIQEARMSGVKGFPGGSRRGSLTSLSSLTSADTCEPNGPEGDGRRGSLVSLDSQV